MPYFAGDRHENGVTLAVVNPVLSSAHFVLQQLQLPVALLLRPMVIAIVFAARNKPLILHCLVSSRFSCIGARV